MAARVERIERLNALRYGVAVERILRRCSSIQPKSPCRIPFATQGIVHLSSSFDFNNRGSILKDEFRGGMPIFHKNVGIRSATRSREGRRWEAWSNRDNAHWIL